MEEKSFIDQPIVSMGFSHAFISASKEMGFKTIAEILLVAPKELVQKEGFNYNWLNELVKFLSKHKLVHLLQPPPGSNPG